MHIGYVYSKGVWKSNFRQYGPMKSRDAKSQREEEKEEEEEGEEKKRKGRRRRHKIKEDQTISKKIKSEEKRSGCRKR